MTCRVCIITGLLIALFAGGVGVGNAWLQKQQVKNRNAEILAEAVDVLENYYIFSVPEIDDAILNADDPVDALISRLPDRYSHVVEVGGESGSLAQSETGTEGLGGIFVWDDNQIKVIQVFPNSPAERIGLKRGSVITEVAGQTTKSLGKEGTFELLLNASAGVDITGEFRDQPFAYTIQSQYYVLQSTRYSNLMPKLGYLEIFTFKMGTAEELHKIINDISKSPVTHLVIDLRGNTGGVANASMVLAEALTSQGTLVTQQAKNETHLVFNAMEGDVLEDLEVVILIDENTASEAEILTAALKDNGRAVVVGGTSFGKGIVTKDYRLSTGQILRIAAAEWFRPSGENVEGVGIEPSLVASEIEEWENIPWAQIW